MPVVEQAVRLSALRYVPGSGEPHIECLRSGLVNRSFRVSRDDRRYVLRVEDLRASGPRAPGLDRVWECRVLQMTSGAGIAPPVIACEPRAGVLVTEWAEGAEWSAQQAASLPAQTRVAALARRVHALPLPDSPRCMDVRGWRDLYRSQLRRRPPGPLRPAAAAGADVQGEALLVQYESLPPVTPRLCHSDLHRHNLLVTDQDCRLLDWEYAHAGDPFWDLAGWTRSNELRRPQIAALLSSYLQREPARVEQERLALLMRLYDIICRLWAQLAEVQAPRGP